MTTLSDKISEQSFVKYLDNRKDFDVHPNLTKLYDNFPTKIHDLKNIIIYGTLGIGKYTQALHIIQRYSPSGLKYEKKLCVTFNKDLYYLKISDVHYEIDMLLLGHNPKNLWHELIQKINDAITCTHTKKGIILCKNFHEIHGDLLNSFYSYMQSLSFDYITFILLTEHVSFLPQNIINCSEIIHVPVPPKTRQSICEQSNKPLYISSCHNLYNSHHMICDKIIEELNVPSNINMAKLRLVIYDIFIYGLSIPTCIWYIIEQINLKYPTVCNANSHKILELSIELLTNYNSNYHPIYHIERYLIGLIKVVHDIR